MSMNTPGGQGPRHPDDLRDLLGDLGPGADMDAPVTPAPRATDTPWITLVVGILLCAVGGAVVAATSAGVGTLLGVVLLGVGGIALQVGIIAVAVEMALVRSEARRYWQTR